MDHKSKNKFDYPNLILVLVGITVILFTTYSIISLGLIKDNKKVVLNTLENEYYVVGREPTAYQKETFIKLTEELNNSNKDYKKISELVGKSFVIDFFGWSNKDSSFDIGGLQYLKDPKTFNDVAHWEYYQKVDVFNSTYGEGKLPLVKNVNAVSKQIEDFEIDGETFKAYQVSLNWSYDQKGSLNTNEFIKSSVLTLIEDQGKVSIVEVKMVDEVSEDE